MDMNLLNIVIPIFILTICAFFFCFGIFSLLKERRTKKWVFTEGTVVDQEYKRSIQIKKRRVAEILISPVIEYQTYCGKITQKSKYSMSETLYKYYIGQNVAIRYNPHNPTDFRVVDEKSPLFLFGIFTGIGILGAILMAVILKNIFI